jgi:diguanylate cyclase (GGDEF)-like protein
MNNSFFPVILIIAEFVLYLVIGCLIVSGILDSFFGYRLYVAYGLGAVAFAAAILAVVNNGRSRYRAMIISVVLAVAAVHFSASNTSACYNISHYPPSFLYALYFIIIITFAATGSINMLLPAILVFTAAEAYNYFRCIYTVLSGDIPGLIKPSVKYETDIIFWFVFLLLSGIMPYIVLKIKYMTEKFPTPERGKTAIPKAGTTNVKNTSTHTVQQDKIPEQFLGKTSMIILKQDVDSTYIQKSDMEDILSSVVYFMGRNFKAYSALGFIYNAGAHVFELNSFYSKSIRVIKNVRIPLGSGIVGKSGIDNKIFISGDITGYDAGLVYYSGPEMIKSMIAAPIQSSGRELMGMLVIDSLEQNAFREEHKEIMRRFTFIAGALISNVRMRKYMEIMAVTDGLTQLVNHKQFQQQLSMEIERSHRYGRSVSMLMIDIDHFKNVNDTYGHTSGDIVLKEVARCIRESIRMNDIAARYGGEEFAVIIPDANPNSAFVTAERIRKKVELTSVLAGTCTIRVTLSAGCASYPLQAKSQQELVERADRALYYSKENGRNRSSIYSDSMSASMGQGN